MKLQKKILKNFMKNMKYNVAGCLAGLIICFLLGLLLSGCKPTKEIETQIERVEVPVPIVQEHTIETVKIDHIRDTLIQRDSVYHYVQGDTVRIERWHYVQGSSNVVRVDTLIKYDSIEVPVEVVREKTRIKTQIKEVEKKLNWYQKSLMWLGGISLILIIGICALKFMKRKSPML